MPSIRKRLKKLTSSKKSKSTSDLDRMEQPDGQSIRDDDTCSHASEAMSERTDVSMNESTYSYASKDEEVKKKKRRRLKISFLKKKKKEELVKDPSGNVLFRSLSVEHDTRGIGRSSENISFDDSVLRPESVHLSKSVGSNIGRDDSSEADGWRMSGLLESVDRTSDDNLIQAFEERRKLITGKPEAESTPAKDSSTQNATTSHEDDHKDGNITTYTRPTHIIEVSFADNKHSHKKEAIADQKDQISLPEEKISGTDDDDLDSFKVQLEPVVEEDFTELRNVDPECEIDFDEGMKQNGGVNTEEVVVKPEESSDGVKIETETEEKPIEVIDQHSVVCDTGRGKRVIIRHLEEVVNHANMELSENVNMEDWLVLNIEKDDWVVVGYNKVGGKVVDLFEQSVDTL